MCSGAYDPNSELRTIILSSMENFFDTNSSDEDALFASFEIYDNSHPDLMKDIAIIARKNLFDRSASWRASTLEKSILYYSPYQ